MPAITLLSEHDLRRHVPLDMSVIDCIESAFAALAAGHVVMPPILSMAIKEYNGEIDVKTAYVPELESFAVKMSPGFFDNPALGLPSTSGLMVLFSTRTGMLEALLLDNGYLTDLRTAAAGAVAARHLSRVDATQVCIIGAGVQAACQLAALCQVRPIAHATLWSRDPEKARVLALRLGAELDIAVSATDDREAAVREADIIITTTPSSMPLVEVEWLCAGQHITAMGSDQTHKNELRPACLVRADRYVPDRQAQTARLGELHHAMEAGLIESATSFPELGAIVSGRAAGRLSSDEITICDLTGTGVQDTAIACLARQRCADADAGSRFEGGESDG